MADDTGETLLETPLHALHVRLGAKMVPFAGYSMPVQYKDGVLKEHLHTRAAIPYRDPHQQDAATAIRQRRGEEQERCALESTSAWQRRWIGTSMGKSSGISR